MSPLSSTCLHKALVFFAGANMPPKTKKHETLKVSAKELSHVIVDVGCPFSGYSAPSDKQGPVWSTPQLIDLDKPEKSSKSKTEAKDEEAESLCAEVQARHGELMTKIFTRFPVRTPGKRVCMAALRFANQHYMDTGKIFCGIDLEKEKEAADMWFDNEGTKLHLLWDHMWKAYDQNPVGSKRPFILRYKLVLAEGQSRLRAERLAGHCGEHDDMPEDTDNDEVLELDDDGDDMPEDPGLIELCSDSEQDAEQKQLTKSKPRQLTKQLSVCSVSSTEHADAPPEAKKPRQVAPAEPPKEGPTPKPASIYKAASHRALLRKPARVSIREPVEQPAEGRPKTSATKDHLTKALNKFSVDHPDIKQAIANFGIKGDSYPNARVVITDGVNPIYVIKDGTARNIPELSTRIQSSQLYPRVLN